MAEIIQDEGGGRKKGKRRPKKHSTHIDMTPMVDLMTLLLTFFMLTTAFSKPKAMEIVLPEKDQKENKKEDKENQIPKWRAVNIILDENDKIYYYTGLVEKPPYPELIETDFSKDGIRKYLLKRNRTLYEKIDSLNVAALKSRKPIPPDTLAKQIRELKKADKVGPIVLIKATDKVKYRNMVDIIDEMAICNIARYAIVDINPQELKMLEEYKKKSSVTANK
ncbi:MAG: ExbD/TolR family protein [Bacteroidales bacterium]